MSKLLEIQHRLKAPKGQYNKFGKYRFRSCEDILEAVKPILYEVGCTLLLTDTIEFIGDRYYIKATAWLKGEDTDEVVTAYAREAETKTGMDASQITGTASSYARKYALNGLFCIDDTKDADTDEYAEQTSKEKKTAPEQKKPEQKPTKEVFDPNHPLWQKALDKMVAGKGSIKALQEVYSISASVEESIKDYLEKHRKQN